MAFVSVVDVGDPRLRDYCDLTDVALRSRADPAAGIYIAESSKVLRRALAAGHQPRSVLALERFADDFADLAQSVDVFVGTSLMLEQITGFNVHRGVLAAMHRPVLPSVDQVISGSTTIAVLEDIVDHTNVGAAFRSAAALGVDGILITPRCADPLYRRSVRVSMGAVFDVPWTRIDPWPSGVLQDAGFTTAAFALRKDAVNLDEFAANRPKRVAVVLGTEGDGLSWETIARCDVVVRIPMAASIDSLNVAAASAVAFWALRN